ncbi:hypothetical protein K439DRAFT_1624982 [Ramaria rubella]|nr:hypothetical protein K439DRAFT_1624982 [Ramaria rubella]
MSIVPHVSTVRVVIVVVGGSVVAVSSGQLRHLLLPLLPSPLSPLALSLYPFSNLMSTCETAHVRVMVGVSSASESVQVYLWYGSRLVGGGVLKGSTGAVDGGVEPQAAASGRGWAS